MLGLNPRDPTDADSMSVNDFCSTVQSTRKRAHHKQ